jgi:hypothetical protein
LGPSKIRIKKKKFEVYFFVVKWVFEVEVVVVEVEQVVIVKVVVL